jgi:hypothetical protein
VDEQTLASEPLLASELSDESLVLLPSLDPESPSESLARATLSVVNAGTAYAPSANAPMRLSAQRRDSVSFGSISTGILLFKVNTRIRTFEYGKKLANQIGHTAKRPE